MDLLYFFNIFIALVVISTNCNNHVGAKPSHKSYSKHGAHRKGHENDHGWHDTKSDSQSSGSKSSSSTGSTSEDSTTKSSTKATTLSGTKNTGPTIGCDERSVCFNNNGVFSCLEEPAPPSFENIKTDQSTCFRMIDSKCTLVYPCVTYGDACTVDLTSWSEGEGCWAYDESECRFFLKCPEHFKGQEVDPTP